MYLSECTALAGIFAIVFASIISIPVAGPTVYEFFRQCAEGKLKMICLSICFCCVGSFVLYGAVVNFKGYKPCGQDTVAQIIKETPVLANIPCSCQ